MFPFSIRFESSAGGMAVHCSPRLFYVTVQRFEACPLTSLTFFDYVFDDNPFSMIRCIFPIKGVKIPKEGAIDKPCSYGTRW